MLIVVVVVTFVVRTVVVAMIDHGEGAPRFVRVFYNSTILLAV